MMTTTTTTPTMMKTTTTSTMTHHDKVAVVMRLLKRIPCARYEMTLTMRMEEAESHGVRFCEHPKTLAHICCKPRLQPEERSSA